MTQAAHLTPYVGRAAPIASAERAPRLSARLVGSGDLPAMAAPLRALYHACADANPFYGPDFLLPLLRHDDTLKGARFVIVEARPEGELVAFTPFLPETSRLPGLRSAVSMLRHPFIFAGMPLMRAGVEEAAWRTTLDALEADRRPGILRIPPSPLDSAVATGLIAALAADGRESLTRRRGEHAGIVAAGTLDAYLARLKGKTAGKLRRHERDLAKLGEVGFRAASSGPELAAALDDFVALEAGGWKGRQGTAFASDPRSLAFIRAAVLAGNGAPGARIEHLTLDGRPIGACLHLVSRGYSVTFKIAYDEAFARNAPGILTALASLRTLKAERWTQRLDSGISPDDAAGVVWRDPIPVGEMLVALSPRQSLRELRFHDWADGMIDTGRSRARDLYYRLTGRKRTQARKTGG